MSPEPEQDGSGEPRWDTTISATNEIEDEEPDSMTSISGVQLSHPAVVAQASSPPHVSAASFSTAMLTEDQTRRMLDEVLQVHRN